jgi:hypothetical protein
MWGRWGTTIPHKVSFLVAAEVAEVVNRSVKATSHNQSCSFFWLLSCWTRAVAAQLWLLIYDAHLWSVLQVPMLVVFGKPIELPKMDHPSKEEIQKYLQLYVNAMQALCQKHKDSAGYGGTTFKVV